MSTSDTYYFIGDRIVKSFVQSTSIRDDADWVMFDPEANVVGQYFKSAYWMFSREIAEEIIGGNTDPQLNIMIGIPDDHHLVKLIKMYELAGALPKPEDEK